MDERTLTLRRLLAAVLGAVMGLEREMKRGNAGLRTHLLGSLGACLYVLAGAYGFLGDAAANLWLAAAVGVTCATGRWKLALFALALSLLALAPLERHEKRLPHPKLDDRHQTES